MLVANYRRDDDDDDEEPPCEVSQNNASGVHLDENCPEAPSVEEAHLTPAPIDTVDLTPKLSLSSLNRHKRPKTSQNASYLNNQVLLDNPTVDNLNAPLVGPTRGGNTSGGLSVKNTFTGYVEDETMNLRLFERQMMSFVQEGVALDPTGQKLVYNAFRSVSGGVVREERAEKKRRSDHDPSRDPSNVNGFLGTWSDAGSREVCGVDPEAAKGVAEVTESNEKENVELDEEKKPIESGIWKATLEEREGWLEAPKFLKSRAESRNEGQVEAISNQVLKMLRTGTEDETASSNRKLLQKIKPVEFDNYLPKRCVKTWSDAESGVSLSRFFPSYGHLLLSSSMDGKLRMYEVYNRRRCLMVYSAHTHAVRDFDWNSQGTHAISCSYDKTVKLWDVETGQVTLTFESGALPIVGRFYPIDSNIFLVGQSDKKIVQWDARTNQIVQEYNRHLGAINTITWIDENRRFVTSSDDKSLRVWEYNIPVDIKYIAEPHMHSMPSITLHANKKWFLCQSLDNQILVYSTKDRFRLNRKKRFTGHLIAGYACNITVSPDGRCVTSGDSHGNLIFWDWKTTRILKKIKAHDNVAIDIQWHPLEPSRIVSSSWDKVIKLWD